MNVYPKCKEGYNFSGCCTCKPSGSLDCSKLGLNPGDDLKCAKIIKTGVAKCKNQWWYI